MRWAVLAVMLSTVATAAPSEARAEGMAPGMALAADARGGIEGGGSGYAAGVRRSRTILRLGAEGWLYRGADDMLALGLVAELEPALGIGGDFRYQRRLVDWMLIGVGPAVIFAPETLLGPTLNLSFRPQLDDDIELDVGPMGNLYLLGSDLPEGVIVGQFLLNAGLRFGL